MLHGMVFKKEAEGDVTSVKDARIAVYSCPFDCTVTETKVMNTKSFIDACHTEQAKKKKDWDFYLFTTFKDLDKEWLKILFTIFFFFFLLRFFF